LDKKIVGVFETEQEAERAVENLKTQGYRAEDISIIARDRDRLVEVEADTESKLPQGLASGAATGGALGGTAGLLAGLGLLAVPGIGPLLAAGPIAAALTGAAVGAAAGGFTGGLIGHGISENDAREYEGHVKEGKILVVVDADGTRDTGVYDSFRSNRSVNAKTYK
jgi:uncharacterized membrane protein